MPNILSQLSGTVTDISNVIGGATSAAATTFSIVRYTGSASQQVLKNLKVKKVEMNFESQVFSHTLEDGTALIDSKITKGPVVIIDYHSPDKNTRDELLSILYDKNNFYGIQSKGLIFQQMRSEDDGFTHSGENLSADPGRITFRQQLLQNANQTTFANASDGNNVGLGITIPSAVTTVIGAAQSLSNKVSGIISGVLGG